MCHMAYPHSFHRLVIFGTHYTETWNTSLSMSGPGLPEVSPSMLAAIAAVVSPWFTSTGGSGAISFLSTVKLTGIKLNRINEAGRYQDPSSQTHLYPTPLSGGATASTNAPPQLAVVATLLTAFDRGRASKGRMYLPPVSGAQNVGSDGRMATADALRTAMATTALLNNLRTAYVAQYGPGPDSGGAAVMSNVGAGAWHFVTKVRAGRVVDTMRSRRSSLAEDPQLASTSVAVPS